MIEINGIVLRFCADPTIDFGFVPRVPRDRAARKLYVEATVQRVQRALQHWYYAEYC